MSKHFISIVHTPAGTFTSYTQAHVERIHCFIEWIPSPNWFTPTNLYCLVVDFSSPKWCHPVMDFQSPKFCQKQVTIHVFSQQQVFQIFNFSHLRTYDPLKLARHELHIHVIICLHPFDITITWRYRHHRSSCWLPSTSSLTTLFNMILLPRNKYHILLPPHHTCHLFVYIVLILIIYIYPMPAILYQNWLVLFYHPQLVRFHVCIRQILKLKQPVLTK